MRDAAGTETGSTTAATDVTEKGPSRAGCLG